MVTVSFTASPSEVHLLGFCMACCKQQLLFEHSNTLNPRTGTARLVSTGAKLQQVVKSVPWPTRSLGDLSCQLIVCQLLASKTVWWVGGRWLRLPEKSAHRITLCRAAWKLQSRRRRLLNCSAPTPFCLLLQSQAERPATLPMGYIERGESPNTQG